MTVDYELSINALRTGLRGKKTVCLPAFNPPPIVQPDLKCCPWCKKKVIVKQAPNGNYYIVHEKPKPRKEESDVERCPFIRSEQYKLKSDAAWNWNNREGSE